MLLHTMRSGWYVTKQIECPWYTAFYDLPKIYCQYTLKCLMDTLLKLRRGKRDSQIPNSKTLPYHLKDLNR